MPAFVNLASLAFFLDILAISTALPVKETQASIQWRSCGGSLDNLLPPGAENFPRPVECATLAVPLDYTDEEAGELDLDLVRVKALKEPARASILFNPGGPGHLGIEYVATRGDDLMEALNGDYDLIGFDTRGTGKTIPFACNISALQERSSKNTDTVLPRSIRSANLTEYLFNGGWELANAFAKQCAMDNKGHGQLISTAFVARDMLKIVDALGEDGMLHYWGASYGTTLGQTFAAMFPDRVGRLVLDAVANPKTYTSGSWIDSIYDAEKSYRGYLKECMSTPENCELAQFVGVETSPEELEQLIDEAMERLDQEPPELRSVLTTYETPNEDQPAVSKYDIKDLILKSMYSIKQWPILTTQLVSLLNGTIEPAPEASESEPAESTTEPYNLGLNALQGIMCSDTTWRASGPEDMLPIVEAQNSASSFSDIFFQVLTWPCAAWQIEPKERYAGDYKAKTRNPMLFVNTEHDPVTSMSGAENATAGFEGSVLLKSTGFGHGLLGHQSECILEAIRLYFETGELPAEGTVCEPDQPAFIAAMARAEEAV